MKILKLFIIIIFLITNFTKANSNESKDNLVNKISKNIRCLICQGQSIYDSQSDFSISMRLVIKKKFGCVFFVIKLQFLKERRKFVYKFGSLNTEKIRVAKSQKINEEILLGILNSKI